MTTNRERLKHKWQKDITSHSRPYPEDYRERIEQSVSFLTDKEVDDYMTVLDNLEKNS